MRAFAAPLLLVGLCTLVAPAGAVSGVPEGAIVVRTTKDAGPGSLRQALLDANAREGPDTILLDAKIFAEPQSIVLASPLPEPKGEIVVDGYITDRLWLSSGATIRGSGGHRLLRVSEGARVVLRSLTFAEGSAEDGGAILNRGTLVLEGMAFEGNAASRHGGAVANDGGTLTVINSTFAGNRAGEDGGGLAHLGGVATVTHGTFSGNAARRGGALYAAGTLTLRNSILANSPSGLDCVATGTVPPAATRTLVESGEGCGTPITSEDPRLGELGFFNGPTKTFPLVGGSPAINLGDVAAATDAEGRPLVWDQRGNGDPRFVAGFPDLGAFEHQAFPRLVVDTAEDTDLRACTEGGARDCPLRGALELASATPKADVIRFDPRVFAAPTTIVLRRPLPPITAPVYVDAGEGPAVRVEGPPGGAFEVAPGALLGLRGVEIVPVPRAD